MTRCLVLLAVLCALLPATARAQPQILLSDGSLLDGVDDPSDFQPLPVLFVHGHGGDPQANWQNPGTTLLHQGISFKEALDLPANGVLGIEPYYISFPDQDRSILEDAAELAEAVEIILNRHDPAYDLALPPAQRATPVQLVVIAYSKGTISTRLYLKSLQSQVPGLPAPRPGFRPVSTFVAISPPNHGIPPTGLFGDTDSTAVKQLNNGYDANCVAYDSPAVPWVTDFYESLNGYPLPGAASAPAGQRAGEAPGLRTPGEPPHAGTLYVSIYADGNRDIVGGHDPSSDCQGRQQARNLADGTVNLALPEIPGQVNFGAGASLVAVQRIAVHAYTVHDAEVICTALYAAAHRSAPPAGTSAADLCVEQGAIPVVPPPPRASVGLALDFSGSMGLPTCPQAGCPARHEVLKDAVELFVRLWTALGLPRDHLAVVLFRSTAAPLSLNGVELVPLLDGSNAGDLVAQVGGEAPGGLTAMGGGLAQAIGILQGTVGNRRVVLLTDGLQNVPPLVVDQGSHREIATTPTPIRLDTLGLAVDAIAVGEGAFTDRLQQIATDTGGRFLSTLDPAQDLRVFFVEELIAALRGFSPQLVGYRHGTSRREALAEDFALSEGARRAVFKLSWSRGAELDIRIERDGEDVTAKGALSSGPFYRIVSFDTSDTGGAMGSGGQWRMVISGDAGVAYQAAAIVDEPALDFDVAVRAAERRAGTPLELEVALFDGARPLDEGIEVTATVFVPKVGVGTLLATESAKHRAPAGLEPGTSAGQRKLARLLRDEVQWRKLLPQPRQVALAPAGDGRFSATFGETTIPGSYRVVFEVAGDDPDLGRLERRASAVMRLGIGPVDPAKTELGLTALERTSPERELVLRLRPRDGHGNFLGPDRGDAIDVRIGDGAQGPIGDLGNGSYLVPLSVPAEADPEITVAVAGQPLFVGALSELPSAGAGRGPARMWIILLVVVAVCAAGWLAIHWRRRRS